MSAACHYFDPVTGLIRGRSYEGPAEYRAANAPEGHHPVDGVADWASQRVNLVTDGFGDQVPVLDDYQPPKPDDTEFETWSWSASIRRWVSAPTVVASARDARQRRDLMLVDSDWVAARASDRKELIPESWQVYRQALRDLPLQVGFPIDIDWPIPPA